MRRHYLGLGLMMTLTTACLLPGAGVAHAQGLPVVNVNNEVGLAFSELIKNYKEYAPPGSPGYDRENGAVPGFAVSGSIMRDIGGVSNVYASLIFRYSNGNIAYTGSLQDGTPVSDDSGLIQKDLRLELGKGFLLTDKLLLTPVFQYGYHVWNRDLGEYYEDYSNSYIGGALHVDYAVTDRLVTRFRAGIATTVSPQIYISSSAQTYPLGIRPVYQLGGGLDYAITPRIHLTADADFSHYSYGQSPQIAGLLEPNSATNDLYVEFGAAYRF